MQDEVLDDLTRRFECLEREHRALKRVGGGLVVGLSALFLMGQALPSRPPRVLEAERFVLRDGRGRTRAALGLGADGSAGLALADPDGRLRASLMVGADGAPGLGLFDQEEKSRAALVVAGSGVPSLSLYDSQEQARAGLTLRPDGSPEVVLHRR